MATEILLAEWSMDIPESTPVLVGGGELMYKLPVEEAKTPLECMTQAAQQAAEDAGLTEAVFSRLDTVGVVRMALDSVQNLQGMDFGTYKNIPRSLAYALGGQPEHEYYAHTGGNTPQMLVNMMAERIAQGKSDVTLLAGTENLYTLMGSLKQGKVVNWQDDPGGKPMEVGDSRPGCTEHEAGYGLFAPINTYPMFENAIRGSRGKTVAEHMPSVGELFSRFTKVASENPLSWFPTYRSADELITPSKQNRYVGYPYTKYLNSVINVDMSAAVLMMSVKTARELGVSEDRWVFLNGCADAKDHYFVSERVNYHSSPAIKHCASETFNMAGISLEDVDYMDIYSCFPSAVAVACSEIGIAEDDPRGLTITGGLPYFGGPGNNYVMHSIKQMMDKVRAKPGSHGLVTANGWHLTKHSMGLYSTVPQFKHWHRANPDDYQAKIDATPGPNFTETPSGQGTIETYTITHSKEGVRNAIIIGRLEDGTRFLAVTPKDPNLVEKMKQVECLGLKGTVTQQDGINIFIPDFSDH